MVMPSMRIVGAAMAYLFFQAEDGIRVYKVTGVQTCALPISKRTTTRSARPCARGIPTGTTRLRGAGDSRRRSLWTTRGIWSWSCARWANWRRVLEESRRRQKTGGSTGFVDLRPTGGRGDAVHAGGHHQLAVMVEAVPRGDGDRAAAGHFAIPERGLHQLQLVLLVQCQGGFMRVGESSLGVWNDLVPGDERIRAFLRIDIHRRLLFLRRRRDHIDDRREVLHLLRKGTDSFELAAGGSEGIFFGRHGLGQRDDIALRAGDLGIVQPRDGWGIGGRGRQAEPQRARGQNESASLEHRQDRASFRTGDQYTLDGVARGVWYTEQ